MITMYPFLANPDSRGICVSSMASIRILEFAYDIILFPARGKVVCGMAIV